MRRFFSCGLVFASLLCATSAYAQTAIEPWDVQQACKSISLAPFSKPLPLTIEHAPLAKTSFMVELADSYAEREQGLMCRRTMAANHGMIFAFNDNVERNFWMKNTRIALDIIFIDAHGKIISIQKNARPYDETPLPSFGKAVAVLEINAGLSDKLKIKVGDKIKHPYFKSWH